MLSGDFTFAYLKYHLRKSSNYKQTYIKARGEINESFFITCPPKRETAIICHIMKTGRNQSLKAKNEIYNHKT